MQGTGYCDTNGISGPAVENFTVSGGNIWYIESKSKYRNDPAFKDKDPGPFAATAIPLPAKK